MPTIRTLYKGGNSIVLSVPSHVAEWIDCDKGSTVVIDIVPGVNGEPNSFNVRKFTVEKTSHARVAPTSTQVH